MFWPSNAMTGFPNYAQESVGGVGWPKFPVINESLTIQQPNAAQKLGQLVFDGDGNIFQYVKASATLAQGNLVKVTPNVTGTVITADSTGDNIHKLKTNITGITVKNSEKGNFLALAQAGYPLVYSRIKGNSITSGGFTYFDISLKDVRLGRGGYDADATAAVIANGVVCHLHRLYNVTPTTTLGDFCVGVAMGAVTSGNATLVQVHGVGLVLCAGDVDAIADNGPVVVSGTTAGTGKGKLGAGMTAVEASTIIGFAKFLLAAAATLIPVQINVLGKH